MDEFSAIKIIDVFVEITISSTHSHIMLEFRSSCINQIPIKLIWNPAINCSLSNFKHRLRTKIPVILNEIRSIYSDECPLIRLLFPNHIIVQHVILIVLFVLRSLLSLHLLVIPVLSVFNLLWVSQHCFFQVEFHTVKIMWLQEFVPIDVQR